MSLATEKQLTIADGGQVLYLTYAGLLEFHHGDSWFGLCVGFRALQLAGKVLSATGLWDRQDLYVESGHPGPGVRDAIEYVTRCISRKRFRLANPREGLISSPFRHAGANRHPVDNVRNPHPIFPRERGKGIPAFAGMAAAEGYVNQAPSRSAFRCSRDMRFEWRVSDGYQATEVRLRPYFVPDAFFDLLDQRDTGQERPDDRQRFDDLKRELSERLWRTPLEASFVGSLDTNLRRHASTR